MVARGEASLWRAKPLVADAGKNFRTRSTTGRLYEKIEVSMATENALALVVRGLDWSETSRITTLFTREFGKVRALAKGGRRLKSNFDVAFDLLTVCQVVLIRKSSDGLDLLTEARMEERFPVLREKLSALYAGYYLAELLADGTQDYDPHPALFESAIGTLRRLGERDSDPQALVTVFELVWLRELGYRPRLDDCAGCGAHLFLKEDVGRVLFSPASGGVICRGCWPNVSDGREISRLALAALRELNAVIECNDPVSTSLIQGSLGEIRPIFGQTVSFVLGRRPRLLGYVDAR
jgi:DNA repair protein RecO (recombination protein O)